MSVWKTRNNNLHPRLFVLFIVQATFLCGRFNPCVPSDDVEDLNGRKSSIKDNIVGILLVDNFKITHTHMLKVLNESTHVVRHMLFVT